MFARQDTKLVGFAVPLLRGPTQRRLDLFSPTTCSIRVRVVLIVTFAAHSLNPETNTLTIATKTNPRRVPHVLRWTMASESRPETYEVQFQYGDAATINRIWKNTPDELKTLQDRDEDGVNDLTEVLIAFFKSKEVQTAQ